jgi:Tfp pilus assembly major pilin PilA
VFVYGLVTRATVEEKIVQRAKEKRALESAVMDKQPGHKETQEVLAHGAQELFKGGEARENARIVYDDAALQVRTRRSSLSDCGNPVSRALRL